jgi:hypothetical protein
LMGLGRRQIYRLRWAFSADGPAGLLVAFQYRIEEPDFESGLLRLATIVGHELDPTNFHAVLAEALANGYIRDPIRLPPSALQCHWHLELTPVGVDEVLRFLRQHGKIADELLADARESHLR